MLNWSLAFLIIALMAASLDSGEDAGIATWLAESFFILSAVLFLSALISHHQRQNHETEGKRLGH